MHVVANFVSHQSNGQFRFVTSCREARHPITDDAKLRFNEKTLPIFEVFNPSVSYSVPAASSTNKAGIASQGHQLRQGD